MARSVLRFSFVVIGFVLALCGGGCGGGGELRGEVGAGGGGAGGGAGSGGGGHAGRVGGQLAALSEAGADCTLPGDCKSGFCSAGVCCRSDCSGACQSCAVDGSVGTCTNVRVGADPRNDCSDDGAASAICRAQSCAGSTVSHAARSDGAGACGSAAADSCGAYIWNAAGDGCRG